MKRFTPVIFLCLCMFLLASDWPVFKGNLYFTGNNDEIIVKNPNLKWLYQADDRTFNPVVSDGCVYFLDMRAMLYCLNEEYGRVLWKKDVRSVSETFRSLSRAAGKVKYPLIQGTTLFLSDPVALYAFDKRSGDVLWARTGMRLDQVETGNDLASRRTRPQVDGIYSDPVLSNDKIFYGTRKTFMARDGRNGHLLWNNDDVQSFSAFPAAYDDVIITQSMDYTKGMYALHCLERESGKTRWVKNLDKPEQIFPPVVYRGSVYIPVGRSLKCISLKDGTLIWSKDYEGLVTTVPGFTERAIILVLDNRTLAMIEPSDGTVRKRVECGEGASPYFVTVRDQIYIATNGTQDVKDKKMTFGTVRALNLESGALIWEFRSPFPGAVSQPVASGGILFFPCGNYLYAIGTEYYARNVDGGSGFAVIPERKDAPLPPERRAEDKEVKEVPTRPLALSLKDRDGHPLRGQVEVHKRDEKGRDVFSRVYKLDGEGTVNVPRGDAEIIASTPGYIPRKENLTGEEKEKTIELDKIRTGKSYVIENVEFEFNSAYLKKECLDILSRLVSIMRENPGLRVEIRGYTDTIGDAGYNKKLSERRADAVAEYMIKQGISPERVSSQGFGKENPIASNDTEEGRRKNRRTEFYIRE